MGFIARMFGRKRTGPRTPPGAPTEIDPYHYELAHRALPGFAFASPAAFRQALEATPEVFVTFVLAKVTAAIESRCGPPTLTSDDIVVRTAQMGGRRATVFAFPTPTFITGVHLSAVVWPADGESGVPPLWYYTLEHGMDAAGTARTVMGSWDARNTHSNYGTGPVPDLASFVNSCMALLPGESR